MPTKLRSRPEPYDAGLSWLRHNGHDLGLLTGFSSRALIAVDACWRAYSVSSNRSHLIAAVASILGPLDRRCWRLAVELVARHLDWNDRYEVVTALRDHIDPSLAPHLWRELPGAAPVGISAESQIAGGELPHREEP